MSRLNTPETFFRSPLETVHLHYPILLYPSLLPTREMNNQEIGFLDGNPHALTQEVLRTHLYEILQSDALIEALDISGIEQHELVGFDAIPVFQGGREGIISFIRARTKTKEPLVFVTHVSRDDTYSEHGKRLHQEYLDLTYLFHSFSKRVPEYIRRHINIIKPYSYSEDIRIDGKTYPIMILPFDPKGELRVSSTHDEIFPLSHSHDIISDNPFFHFAVPYNPKMEKMNRLLLPRPNRPFIGNRVDHAEQLLLQQALIYLSTDGQILQDFRLNAGDILGWFSGKELSLTLTSVHNGFSQPDNDADWIQIMSSQLEEFYIATNILRNVHTHFYVKPFPFESSTMTRILLQAKSIVGKQKRNNFPR